MRDHVMSMQADVDWHCAYMQKMATQLDLIASLRTSWAQEIAELVTLSSAGIGALCVLAAVAKICMTCLEGLF